MEPGGELEFVGGEPSVGENAWGRLNINISKRLD
jgi:hypothetical protein